MQRAAFLHLGTTRVFDVPVTAAQVQHEMREQQSRHRVPLREVDSPFGSTGADLTGRETVQLLAGCGQGDEHDPVGGPVAPSRREHAPDTVPVADSARSALLAGSAMTSRQDPQVAFEAHEQDGHVTSFVHDADARAADTLPVVLRAARAAGWDSFRWSFGGKTHLRHRLSCCSPDRVGADGGAVGEEERGTAQRCRVGDVDRDALRSATLFHPSADHVRTQHSFRSRRGCWRSSSHGRRPFSGRHREIRRSRCAKHGVSPVWPTSAVRSPSGSRIGTAGARPPSTCTMNTTPVIPGATGRTALSRARTDRPGRERQPDRRLWRADKSALLNR